MLEAQASKIRAGLALAAALVASRLAEVAAARIAFGTALDLVGVPAAEEM